MMISLITAWVATICVIFTALKFFAKKNQRMNRIFHRIHIPVGILLIAAGLVHGLFAGNPLGVTIRQAVFGKTLFTWNMGTVCFILSILLGITYLFRKMLKANWMELHRILTVMLVVSLAIHIFQMGIKLPYAISSLGKNAGSSNTEQLKIEEENDTSEELGKIEESKELKEPEGIKESEESEGLKEPEETEGIKESEKFEESEEIKEIEESTKTDDFDSVVTFSGASLKDGIYEGSADGYASVITVSVVVENGAVTDISIVEENDTPQFFEYAKGIINTILDRQSLEVDGITGATYSSKGIQNAVYDALQNAVISGELKITDIQISNSRGHGKPHHRPEH